MFSTGDVPAVSSDGYKLRGPIEKLFITSVIASANGFEKRAVNYPERIDVIELSRY